MNKTENRGHFYHSETLIITLLDQLRIQSKLSIENFTEGIISKRNYSRYLNGELKISYLTLSKLLEKLNISISSFSFFIQNSIITKYDYELDFFDEVTKKDYKRAMDIYETKIKGKPLYTHLSEKSVPSGIIYLSFILGQKDLKTAKLEIKDIIHFHQLPEKHVYTDDDIGSLYIYSLIADEQDKKIIADWLEEVIVEKKHKSFYTQPEPIKYLKYIMMLKILTEKETIDPKTQKLIDIVTTKALDHDRRARIIGHNQLLLKILYEYAHKSNDAKKDIYSFYYLSSLMTLKEDIIKNQAHHVKKEDYELFLKQLQDDKYLKMEAFKELICDDYI